MKLIMYLIAIAKYDSMFCSTISCVELIFAYLSSVCMWFVQFASDCLSDYRCWICMRARYSNVCDDSTGMKFKSKACVSHTSVCSHFDVVSCGQTIFCAGMLSLLVKASHLKKGMGEFTELTQLSLWPHALKKWFFILRDKMEFDEVASLDAWVYTSWKRDK